MWNRGPKLLSQLIFPLMHGKATSVPLSISLRSSDKSFMFQAMCQNGLLMTASLNANFTDNFLKATLSPEISALAAQITGEEFRS